MAGEQGRWNTEPDGSVVYETGPFRLVTKEIGGAVRFMVFHSQAEGERSRMLLGSGTADNAWSAMASARRMADRFV